MSIRSSQFLRVKVAGAVVAAVSLGGFAVAAASVVREPTPKVVADPGTSTTDPTTDPTTTPTDPPVTDPSTDPPASDPPVVDPSSAPPATAPCENHGQHVSQVAHETPPGPGHGQAVSAAAHDHEGECGQDGVAPTAPTTATDGSDDPGDDDQGEDHGGPAPTGDAPSGEHGHGGHGGGDD